MILTCLQERTPETRVAISPAVVKAYLHMGYQVICESGLGESSGFSDADYLENGALVLSSRKKILSQSDVLLAVNPPIDSDFLDLKTKSLVITQTDSSNLDELRFCCGNTDISLFSMNHIPRISRAQGMDSLSSQANLAGYRAVIAAVEAFKQAVPMMMTAAGVVQPAKVLVLGVGIAGLQAIATAKRLGAIVYAFDVRSAAREQAESLGAEFVEVASGDDLESATGYALEGSIEYQRLQAEKIHEYALKSDMVICTALIPGKKAPILLKAATVQQLKPGSVIVDLATANGGNCELSEQDKTIEKYGVILIGISNMAGLIPKTASLLYANNVLKVVELLCDPTNHRYLFDTQDEIVANALLCRGEI